MQNDSILTRHGVRNVMWTAIVGGVILAAGLPLAPARLWSNLLVGTFGLLTIGLGGAVFIALTYVCGAGWHVAFRRVPEAMATTIPTTGVAILVVLLVRAQAYGWQHHGHGGCWNILVQSIVAHSGFLVPTIHRIHRALERAWNMARQAIPTT